MNLSIPGCRDRVVMLLYLELAYDKWKKEGRLSGLPALKEAILYPTIYFIL